MFLASRTSPKGASLTKGFDLRANALTSSSPVVGVELSPFPHRDMTMAVLSQMPLLGLMFCRSPGFFSKGSSKLPGCFISILSWPLKVALRSLYLLYDYGVVMHV